MGLMDKVKETAQKGVDATKGAVNAGQEKIDDMKTEKKVKELKEELGGLLYAQKTGSPADDYDAQVTRIVVTHHPFDAPAAHRGKSLVGRAGMAMAGFAECRVGLYVGSSARILLTQR